MQPPKFNNRPPLQCHPLSIADLCILIAIIVIVLIIVITIHDGLVLTMGTPNINMRDQRW